MQDEKSSQSVYERTFHTYLTQLYNVISKIDAGRLGVSIQNNEIDIHILNKTYHISSGGIVDPYGKKPSFEICVIILKYFLTDRNNYPNERSWCSFRDLKESKPLISYFKNNVELAFIKEFSGRVDLLKKACVLTGGVSPEESFNNDVSMQLNVLPKLPVLLLFNDEDEEFPASCSVLFEHRSENYLDAECLAMVGRFLFETLRKTHLEN